MCSLSEKNGFKNKNENGFFISLKLKCLYSLWLNSILLPLTLMAILMGRKHKRLVSSKGIEHRANVTKVALLHSSLHIILYMDNMRPTLIAIHALIACNMSDTIQREVNEVIITHSWKEWNFLWRWPFKTYTTKNVLFTLNMIWLYSSLICISMNRQSCGETSSQPAQRNDSLKQSVNLPSNSMTKLYTDVNKVGLLPFPKPGKWINKKLQSLQEEF